MVLMFNDLRVGFGKFRLCETRRFSGLFAILAQAQMDEHGVEVSFYGLDARLKGRGAVLSQEA